MCDENSTAAGAWVYMLRCPDGSLYTGWTNNLARRLRAHRTGKGGAKYTKRFVNASESPILAYAERCAGKSEALHREAAIKAMPKAKKEALAAQWAVQSRDASDAEVEAALALCR